MKRFVFLLILCLFPVFSVSGQRANPKKTIFAVLNDGKTLEPIAFIEKGKLSEIGESTGADFAGFIKTHYKPKTRYNLIFGGKSVGSATVVKDFADSDCAKNLAEISVYSKTLKPKGFLMALATDAVPRKSVKGFRQRPTMAERREIENLVMAVMKTKKVPIKNTGELRYHNLTKLDIEGDGKYEFVGTYWYETGIKIRSLLFFIAGQDSDSKISVQFSKFEDYDEEKVMSGEIKSLDEGMYHELLLDLFDFDADGQSEIFTLAQGFEGNNFFAYKRIDGNWTQVLETYNYHCGY